MNWIAGMTPSPSYVTDKIALDGQAGWPKGRKTIGARGREERRGNNCWDASCMALDVDALRRIVPADIDCRTCWDELFAVIKAHP